MKDMRIFLAAQAKRDIALAQAEWIRQACLDANAKRTVDAENALDEVRAELRAERERCCLEDNGACRHAE